jgi:hypothetical protein
VSPAATETTEEKEWGDENQDHDGGNQDIYTGGPSGLGWDDIWWFVNNRYNANPEQVSMNHGFILIKPDYVTGVVGAVLLQNPHNEDPRRTELRCKAKDWKEITGTIAGDGPGHWVVNYSSTLYLKAGGYESWWTTGHVGAYAYGRLGININDAWHRDHAGVMRSNYPEDFVNEYCSSINLIDDGTFTDQTAIGELTAGSWSKIDSNDGDLDYDGGGINCEIDVYLRGKAKLSGSRVIDDMSLKIKYYSYGWLLAINEGTSTSTGALAEVQHEKLWYTYRGRSHVITKTYNPDGELLSTVNEPMWSYSLFTESDLETETTTDANGNTVVKYFVKEKYAEYKDDGLWNVSVEAYDDHDPQAGPLLINGPDGYSFK